MRKSKNAHVKPCEKLSKKTIILFAIAVLVLLAAGALVYTGIGENWLNVAMPQTRGSLVSGETGRPSSYSFEILKADKLKNNSVKRWIDKSMTGEEAKAEMAYFTLYNNSGESMDMYLLMPSAQELIGSISRADITVAEAGTALEIKIDTNRTITHDTSTAANAEGGDLVLRVYAKKNAAAKSEMLIVNDKKYTCVKSTFMPLD